MLLVPESHANIFGLIYEKPFSYVFICFHEVFQSSFAVCKFHSKEIQEWCLLQVQTMPLIWPLVPS